MVGGRGAFNVQASKGIHLVVPARPDPLGGRASSPRTEKIGAVRDPVGPALDHRHHRHRLEPRQGAPRGQPRPTSTTCSSTSTRCSASRSTTRTSRACTPGCGRCSPGESEQTSRSSPASTSCVTPVPGPGRDRRRQVHDVPRHGAGRDRRRRPHAMATGTSPSDASPTGSRCSAPRGSSPRRTSACRSPARSGLHVARIDHLLGRYGDLIDELLDLIARRPELGEPLRGAEDYLARRGRLRASPTRAPGTSTTC